MLVYEKIDENNKYGQYEGKHIDDNVLWTIISINIMTSKGFLYGGLYKIKLKVI